MRYRIIIIAFLLTAQNSYSQNSESFFVLSNGTIKNELASFTRAATKSGRTDSARVLSEIKLKRCSSDFAYFEKGDIISLDNLVSIESKQAIPPPIQKSTNNVYCWGASGNNPEREISEVRYIHVKYQLILPDSAIAGLYEPNFCLNTTAKNKIGKSTTSDCKVFQSLDKRRVYIYMLNGKEEKYEVTWVIEDSKYLMRIIDKVL